MKAFGAAAGVFGYCLFMGWFMFNAENWFGRMPNFMAPVLLLTLLSVSVSICGLLFLTRPFLIFWVEKKPREAIFLLVKQTVWLAVFAVALSIWLIVY